MNSDQETALATIIIFFLLLVYVIGGNIFEAKHPCLGHETGVTILLGVIISFILSLTMN